MTSSFSSTLPSSAGLPESWHAQLMLDLGIIHGRTTVRARRHDGPLLVQRPFHPETDGTCHLLLLHPPGGLVSGDQLDFSATLRVEARALVTTPAATKVYRARSYGACARQTVTFVLENEARAEWLPQETIVYDGARVELSTQIELAPSAGFIGWEILCLGRPAAQERFLQGKIVQHWQIRRAGKLEWVERFACSGGSELLDAAYGLGGAPVLATLVAATPKPLATEVLELLQKAVAEREGLALTSVTRRDNLTIARYLGASSEQARACFVGVWRELRASLWGKAAVLPRIWLT